MDDLEKRTCFITDPIETLDLNIRVYNLLKRRSIDTIGELLELCDSGEIHDIPHMGEKNFSELKNALIQVNIKEENKSYKKGDLIDVGQSIKPEGSLTSVKYIPTITNDVIIWQSNLIKKQINSNLLHSKAKLFDKSIEDWLKLMDLIDRRDIFEIYSVIIGSSISIVEELEYLFRKFSYRNLNILLSLDEGNCTLESIGKQYGITRERVRQIRNKVERKISNNIVSIQRAKSVSELVNRPTLLRIQSALLIGRDIAYSITYNKWKYKIISSGLVGYWSREEFNKLDPINAILTISRISQSKNIKYIVVPDNISYVKKLANSGKPNTKAEQIHSLESISDKELKNIKRCIRFTGGANIKWLAKAMDSKEQRVRNVLTSLDYIGVSKNWFIPKNQKINDLNHFDVMHHSLRKMFQYCGPLAIEELCSGLRHSVSRANYPVPPPVVMEKILILNGYLESNGCYSWGGENCESLNTGEKIIFSCIHQKGRVVNHSELAEAFIESNYSFPLLHSTLNKSPLFKKIELGLYQLRGVEISFEDIQRAKDKFKRIPQDLEVKHDKRGLIIVSLNVSLIPLGTGVIFSDNFPNLSGEWGCLVSNELIGNIIVTEKEIRSLGKPFEILNCRPGDRIIFTFNTWKRFVSIEIK